MKYLAFIVVLFFSSCREEDVDFIIYNATIYTVDNIFSTADAMVVRDGKIVHVGSKKDLLDWYDAKEKIDAGGAFIYPGLIDAHAHFKAYGQSLFQVNLYGAKSWEEAVDRIRKFADEHPAEEWITGRGWDQNVWETKEFPNNSQLNQYFPHKPVLVTRVDGHAAIANEKALQLAGVKAGDLLIGGTVETKEGKLTGLLIDNAVDRVSSKLPVANKETYAKWLVEAQNNCFKQGLTTIADCGLMYNDIEMIDVLQKEGVIKMPLYVMMSDDPENYKRYLKKAPYKTDLLFVKGIKVYSDGALGSRGACLMHPYTDEPSWTGFLLKDRNYFDSLAKAVIHTDYQLCTHAIGDSANRVILSIYKEALLAANDKRWRIEHAQVVDVNDFSTFREASIIPSVQPTHATSDMYWAEKRLGPQRIKNAYAYKQLLQQNGWLPLGTDFPVEDISPFKTFLAAVFRQDAAGYPATGFQPENALTREEALRGMTIWAARSCFLEEEVGSLEKGKKANFVILDKDLMKVHPREVLSTKVLATYINGKTVYSAPK